VLFANPPGMSYLMAVPWVLFCSQWGAGYFSTALNLLAVPLSYRAGRLAGGRAVGLAAAALVAINPWVIYFSHGTWVQGLLPFWTALACALLLAALFGRAPRGRWLFAALLALAGLTQMYLLALLSLAPAGLILLLNRRRLPWRALLAGAAALAAATGLFGWQLARDWTDQAPKVARFFETGTPAHFDRAALNHAARMVTGADYEYVFGNDGSPAWLVRRALGQIVATALGAALALGGLRAGWRVARRRPDADLWLAVLIWWVVPIAALTYTSHPVDIAYLLLSLPAGYVLAAPILAPIARGRLGLAALGAYSFVLIAAGTAQVAAQPAGQSLDELSIAGAMQLRPVAQSLADQYHLDEFYTSLDSASLTAKVGRPLRAVSWVPLPQVELFQVGHPAVYMRAGSSRATPLRLASPVGEVDYPGPAVVSFDLIRAYTRAELDALPQHAVGWPSAQGLTLVGYDLELGNQALWVYWTVDALVDGREHWLYAPYAHVVDAQGRMAANAGAPGLPGYYYRPGDVFLSHITMPPLPTGDYRLELGLYDGVHGLSLSLEPPGGAPITDHYATRLVAP
jgi:hypothetical protein